MMSKPALARSAFDGSMAVKVREYSSRLITPSPSVSTALKQACKTTSMALSNNKWILEHPAIDGVTELLKRYRAVLVGIGKAHQLVPALLVGRVQVAMRLRRRVETQAGAQLLGAQQGIVTREQPVRRRVEGIERGREVLTLGIAEHETSLLRRYRYQAVAASHRGRAAVNPCETNRYEDLVTIIITCG